MPESDGLSKFGDFMKALFIIALMVLAAFLVAEKWGIIAVLVLVAMYSAIKFDKGGAAIEEFFAGSFALGLVAGAV